MTDETKAYLVALEGGLIAAITSSLGSVWVPWIVVGVQAITALIFIVRDTAIGGD